MWTWLPAASAVRRGHPYRLWIALCATLTIPATTLIADDPGIARQRMVSEQIESRGIRNPGVLRVMRSTPRHLFVPTDLRFLAYADRPLPIGHGATISQPYIVALMTELLEPSKKQRVLEIGTGSGYQAAVLSQLAAEVLTIEISPELARSAARKLRELGYANVTVRQGDGYEGWNEQAPFDRIIVTAAPLQVPAALLAQLSRGGRLVVPVGPAWHQELLLIEKKPDGSLRRRSVCPVSFVPMTPGRK
jgi:protein-L-isoaspartate(D-aspartate) O-methyltransferase